MAINFLNKQKPITPSQAAGAKNVQSRGLQNRSLAKVYVFMAATALLAGVSGYFLSVKSFALGTIFLVFFTAFFLVQAIAFRRQREALLASIVDALMLMVFFYQENFLYVLASIFFLWVIFYLAHQSGTTQVKNMVKIKFSRAVRPVVGFFLMAIVVFASFVLFVNGHLFLEEDNIGRAVDIIVTPFASRFIDGFASSATLENVMSSVARAQIEQQGGFELLNKFQQNQLITQAANETTASLSEIIGFDLDDQATVKSNATRFITARTQGFTDQSAPLRIALLIGILLLVVKSIEIVLYLPLALIAFVVYELMIAFNLITVQFEAQSKEVVNIIEN